MNKDKPLTIKQQKYADDYIVTGNSTMAAKNAGYKGNYNTLRAIASENLTKPNVKAYIERKKAEIAEKNEITVQTQLNKLETIHRLALADKDYNASISAIREQDKLCGLITDKVQTQDITAVKELTEQEQAEAARLARIRLRTG